MFSTNDIPCRSNLEIHNFICTYLRKTLTRDRTRRKQVDDSEMENRSPEYLRKTITDPGKRCFVRPLVLYGATQRLEAEEGRRRKKGEKRTKMKKKKKEEEKEKFLEENGRREGWLKSVLFPAVIQS